MSWEQLELLACGGTLSLLALWSWLLWRDHRAMLAARLAIAMNLGIASYVVITVGWESHLAEPGLVLAMLADCDVLIENFRTGVADRLGLGYDAVSKLYPNLVYCSISGFGATGPQSQRAAFDLIVQAESGVMSLNGDEDRPPTKLGLPMADLASGMFSVQGILAALLRRARTGKGGLVEVQGTAEGEPFSEEQFLALLALAKSGIARLVDLQKLAIA